MNARGELVRLLRDNSVELGSFTLASGRPSSYYIDARRTTMSARGIELIGPLGLQVIRAEGWAPDCVGGLTLGADPVAYAVALASCSEPPEIDAFTVRKAQKTHGTRSRIEGCFRTGQSVVIVEDVVTTGASALEAIDAVAAQGGAVLGVLALIDRGEGGREAITRAGYELRTMVSLAELGLSPEPGGAGE
ncbi:MAG: orotate phosphoribosyltransferase [Gemmatimonadales bacterium]